VGQGAGERRRKIAKNCVKFVFLFYFLCAFATSPLWRFQTAVHLLKNSVSFVQNVPADCLCATLALGTKWIFLVCHKEIHLSCYLSRFIFHLFLFPLVFGVYDQVSDHNSRSRNRCTPK